LLQDREQELRERHGISFRITGVATRRLGWIADPNGLDPADLRRAGAPALHNVRDWLKAAQADVLFEATSLNVDNGQPAVDHIRAALDHGAHAITANKGPIVHAYRELRDLAAAKGKRFLFESTVMDGVPIFSFFHQMPTIHLQGFHGILNSTTNVILSEMENGLRFDDSLEKAQALGIAETDVTHQMNGLEDIAREGIRDLTTNALRNGCRDGWPLKLVCRAQRVGDGVKASVALEKVLSTSPMGKISGTSSYIYFETDIFPGLAITEENPGLYATAYGMLADFVRATEP
jgi:homoserine dehydrogenase